MRTLRDAQAEFAQHAARLIQRIAATGRSCTLGECLRSDEQAAINAMGEEGRLRLAVTVEAAFPSLALALKNNGKSNGILVSIHTLKLAIDLNLFDGKGVYQPTTEAHRPFGEWWEEQHPLARWGGRFRDGNHYSFEWGGVK